jgi:type IX secretion system PorP/SprF family membrane protein
MKKINSVIIVLLVSLTSFSQQLQTSSLYDLQGVFHNASMAGTAKNNFVGASYKSQWQGISGRPKTMTAFGSFALPNQKLGIGAYIYNDVTGPTSRTGLQLSVAKHIPLQNGGTLSFGIENRIQQYALNKTKLAQTLGSDPVLAGKENSFKYDAGVGASYTSEQFQLGVSVSQLIQSKLDFYSGNLTRTEQARLYRHYYIHSLYNWNVDGETVITPNVLFIYLPNAPLEFQGGVRVEHKNSLWYGVSVRAKQSILLSAGVRLNKKFLIGYSFDIYRTPLSIFDGGSNGHEFVLRYDLTKK